MMFFFIELSRSTSEVHAGGGGWGGVDVTEGPGKRR